MAKILIDRLLALTPRALPNYVEALTCANVVLVPFGILNNELRAEHFFAHVLHESGGFSLQRENMNYTTAKRIRQVWPTRFPTVAAAAPYVRQPEKLANQVYGGRMGNDLPGDGWRFRGRGMIQITGKEMYLIIGDMLHADFISDPDRILDSRYILLAAAALWVHKRCNPMADRDDLRATTRAINGGLHGLAAREQWLGKMRQVVAAGV